MSAYNRGCDTGRIRPLYMPWDSVHGYLTVRAIKIDGTNELCIETPLSRQFLPDDPETLQAAGFYDDPETARMAQQPG